MQSLPDRPKPPTGRPTATAGGCSRSLHWGVMLCFVNASTLNVVLPVVSHDLGSSSAQASWILLSYMLVTTALIPVCGRLADLFGRRRLYMGGLALLTGASVGCGLAPDTAWLLLFRCLQAVGAAAVITNTTALLTDAFSSRTLAFGLGLNSTLSATAQSFGPMLGGAVVSTLGWRAIFLLNLPLGLYALHRAHRTLKDVLPRQNEPFDVRGALLSMMALSGLVYGLSMAGPKGWSSPHCWLALALSVFCFSVFVAAQRRTRHPLIDLGLFADRERATAYACVLLICMAQTSSVLLVALVLQGVQGANAFHAGLSVAPVPVGMMLASPVAGRLMGRFSSLHLSATGLLFVMVGLCWLVWQLHAEVHTAMLGVGLLAIGLGTGLFLTANNSGIMGGVQAQRRGVANAIRSTLQNAGLVLGAALAMSIAIAGLAPDVQRAVYDGRLDQTTPEDVLQFLTGCRWAFAVLAALCLAGIGLCLSTHLACRRRGPSAATASIATNRHLTPPKRSKP